MLKALTEKYGESEVIDNDAFWDDVLKEAFNLDVILPLEKTPENVRILHSMLNCKPGECGDCCRYGETPIYQYDIFRITNNTKYTIDDLQKLIYTRPDGSMFMGGDPPGSDCPFMRAQICTIYNARPDVCWLFPVMKGTYEKGGKHLIKYRIRCKPAIDVVRAVFRGAINDGKTELLPNLTLREKQ